MTMEWKQDDSTGVEVIDVQHRALFGYTNQLERSIAAGISSGRDVDNCSTTITPTRQRQLHRPID